MQKGKTAGKEGKGAKSQLWLSWSWRALTVKQFAVTADSSVVRPSLKPSYSRDNLDHLQTSFIEKETKVQKSQEPCLRSDKTDQQPGAALGNPSLL